MDQEKAHDIADCDVIFLGAGFSRCVSGGVSPLMSDFFATLDDRKYWSLWKFLSECYHDPRSANVEEALLKLDQFCISPLEGKDSFIDECRKRQEDVKSELDSYMIERLGRLPIQESNWAASLLHRVTEKTTVITTNYDNLAERILSQRRGLRHRVANTNCHHCKMCQILGEECFGAIDSAPEVERWNGALLKLHGSVAWKMCGNRLCNSTSCLLPDAHCRPVETLECEECGEHCRPVLVHPAMSKKFDRFRGLKQMWNGAYDALSASQDILFFGFSFPTSDAIICEMIRCTLGRSPGDLRVRVIDVSPETPCSRLEELLSKRDADVHLYSYQVPRDGQEPDWLTSKGA